MSIHCRRRQQPAEQELFSGESDGSTSSDSSARNIYAYMPRNLPSKKVAIDTNRNQFVTVVDVDQDGRIQLPAMLPNGEIRIGQSLHQQLTHQAQQNLIKSRGQPPQPPFPPPPPPPHQYQPRHWSDDDSTSSTLYHEIASAAGSSYSNTSGRSGRSGGGGGGSRGAERYLSHALTQPRRTNTPVATPKIMRRAAARQTMQ